MQRPFSSDDPNEPPWLCTVCTTLNANEWAKCANPRCRLAKSAAGVPFSPRRWHRQAEAERSRGPGSSDLWHTPLRNQDRALVCADTPESRLLARHAVTSGAPLAEVQDRQPAGTRSPLRSPSPSPEAHADGTEGGAPPADDGEMQQWAQEILRLRESDAEDDGEAQIDEHEGWRDAACNLPGSGDECLHLHDINDLFDESSFDEAIVDLTADEQFEQFAAYLNGGADPEGSLDLPDPPALADSEGGPSAAQERPHACDSFYGTDAPLFTMGTAPVESKIVGQLPAAGFPAGWWREDRISPGGKPHFVIFAPDRTVYPSLVSARKAAERV